MSERILHLGDWRLNDITDEVITKAKNCGFTQIQISPVQEDRGISDWWDRYQPISFEIGNILGSREDLIQLGNRCRRVGIGLIADIVVHHTTTDIERSKIKSLIYDVNRNIVDYNNRYELTHFRVAGLPTLNMWKYNLQYYVRSLINDLISCGVTGLRWDAAKHIELPVEGCNFFENTLCVYPELFQYGEVIYSDYMTLTEYQKIMITGTENSQGTDERKCVLWVESHDSYRAGYTAYKDEYQVAREYMDLVNNHRGANTLFYTRPFSEAWKTIRH